MIRYINSEGKEYKFYDARVRATSGNFHKHAWTPETSKRKIGETVQGFEKDAAEYEITFTVRGALEDRKTFLDEMQDAFETDVLLERPGRIYFWGLLHRWVCNIVRNKNVGYSSLLFTK